jgi:hypothetical protein
VLTAAEVDGGGRNRRRTALIGWFGLPDMVALRRAYGDGERRDDFCASRGSSWSRSLTPVASSSGGSATRAHALACLCGRQAAGKSAARLRRSTRDESRWWSCSLASHSSGCGQLAPSTNGLGKTVTATPAALGSMQMAAPCGGTAQGRLQGTYSGG